MQPQKQCDNAAAILGPHTALHEGFRIAEEALDVFCGAAHQQHHAAGAMDCE